jgi:hypothetical protein
LDVAIEARNTEIATAHYAQPSTYTSRRLAGLDKTDDKYTRALRMDREQYVGAASDNDKKVLADAIDAATAAEICPPNMIPTPDFIPFGPISNWAVYTDLRRLAEAGQGIPWSLLDVDWTAEMHNSDGE